MSFSQGEILLVSMLFTDGSGAKRRPAMVVWDGGDDDLLVAPVTSHTVRSQRDVTLTRWQNAGLRLPSIVRLEKLATVGKSTVIRRLGQVEATDWTAIEPALNQFFADIIAA